MKRSVYISPRLAAQRLEIRLDAVYAAIWARRLPAHKADGRWLIPIAAVEERLKAQAKRRGHTSMPLLAQSELR
jgi:excisionase family DNA binding protein